MIKTLFPLCVKRYIGYAGHIAIDFIMIYTKLTKTDCAANNNSNIIIENNGTITIFITESIRNSPCEHTHLFGMRCHCYI